MAKKTNQEQVEITTDDLNDDDMLEDTEELEDSNDQATEQPYKQQSFFLDLAQADIERKLIPAGVKVALAVSGAEAKLSANGNLMIPLRMTIQRVENVPVGMVVSTAERNSWIKRAIRDNILFIPGNEALGKTGTLWRAKLIFEAFGVTWDPKQFRTEAEALNWASQKAEEFIGAVCFGVLGTEKENPNNVNPETGELYPPKNIVTKYERYVATQTLSKPYISDEDIPF